MSRPDPYGGRRGATDLGGEQVEGRQAVRELLLARRREVRDVWIADDLDPAPTVDDVLALAAGRAVPVRRVARAALRAEARSAAPQGVIAHAAPLPVADLDDLCRAGARGDGPPFLLCLDGITDPHNLGSLLRTAECAGVSGVVVRRHRSVRITPTVAKVAAGAVEHVEVALVGGLPAALARLREQGVWAVGLDAGGADTLFDLAILDQPVALVVGAEGRGLGRLTRARCDVVASIPLRGALGSLNAATAAAVGCFEVVRRRLVRPPG
ncbi:MAG: 23S rRNA (guanosine(2251)-2'-O)-methyltransferase RlmB [Acidimicrobiales bacterium]